MKQATAEFIRDMLDGVDGISEVEIRDDYSGRGMLDKTTHAIVVDVSGFKALAIVLSSIFASMSFDLDDYPDVDWGDLGRLQSDSMSRDGSVIY